MLCSKFGVTDTYLIYNNAKIYKRIGKTKLTMDKINKIKVNNVTYEIGSNVDMSQYQLKSDAVKLVRLTQAEYDQLTPKDNNTLYIITDAQ